MASRSGRQGQRAALERKPRGRGGSLFTGLFMGLVAGLLIAAGLAWYFYVRPGDFKNPDGQTAGKAGPVAAKPPVSAEPPPLEISPPPGGTKPQPAARPAGKSGDPAGEPGYSFYDILPGDKPSQPKEVLLPREVWWLQVAALKEEKDARGLKAKLALLGLDVKVHRVDSPSGPLHRVRVGPFKTEDDALGALDTLAVNDYEPRLFKEKLNP